MNAVNTLFVISTIMVPLLLMSINYSAIQDFYTYSVPLNSMKLLDEGWYFSSDDFEIVKALKDSKCFTTPSLNDFCYPPPRIGSVVSTSFLYGNDPGFDGGEMHFDNVKNGTFYFTMKNMTQINGDMALLTLSDNDYRVGNATRTVYEITEKFEFVVTLEKYDTFIAKCNNFEGTRVSIVQYLGIETIDDNDYFVTWHTGADLENPAQCDYPEIIKHSLNHDFGI